MEALSHQAEEMIVSFGTADAAARLAGLCETIDGRLVFTTSFGLEDQVVTHLIATQRLPVEIVTLDTGRLFPEVHALWAKTEARYGLAIKPFYPRHDEVEGFVREHGINGFYGSIAARKACCGARKVEPLGRALEGAAAWITGLRADQSAARGGVALAEIDAERSLVKFNPLLDWNREQALAFARANEVPLNPLHAQGFLSIGCQPCTRAIRPGEPERAGRWWWEEEAAKECGLHLGPDGRLVRVKPAPEVAA
ncbi:phosphoadenylyl-sulfate reductase [Bosea rubneri]|uniref:Adenosine 5'-phosphosulfate reductase n=1 Tax=Bosea rubneri TaxID=3075434 RepID=A0ABU3SEA7_9HYPH|nr:phosphoadenylyl-sulfate reductase [Bosea sp. ZW T0_25]MDU0343097.1 phosphoadenylyl-sulfate reductase [Bosea sp. ZW T0_25]